MSESRIIKKYPNRRLYDTEESRYITLADIRGLVIDGVDFVVIDKKSGEDITRSILLQVISEQEQHGGEAIMSRDFLSQVIRAYGSAMPSFVGTYLEQSLKLFLNQQQAVRQGVKRVVGVDPIAAVAGIAQKNYNRWKSVQEEIFHTLTGGRRESESKRNAPATKDEP